MTRVSPQVATSQVGVALILKTCARAGQVWRETPHTDIGLDGQIEFLDAGRGTGALVGVQVRTGASYVSDDRVTFYVNADRAHFEYWSACTIPVIGIVVDPRTETARWTSLTEHCTEARIEHGPYTVPIGDSAFTVEAVRGPLYALATRYAESTRTVRGSLNADLYLDLDPVTRAVVPPEDKVAWNALTSTFCHALDVHDLAAAGHRLWYYYYRVPESFRAHTRLELAKMTDDEISRALAAGALGLDAGTPAEWIADMLQYIPHAPARVLYVLVDLEERGWLQPDAKKFATQALEMWSESALPRLYEHSF